MPAFWLQGNLAYFAAFKNHIGFFHGERRRIVLFKLGDTRQGVRQGFPFRPPDFPFLPLPDGKRQHPVPAFALGRFLNPHDLPLRIQHQRHARPAIARRGRPRTVRRQLQRARHAAQLLPPVTQLALQNLALQKIRKLMARNEAQRSQEEIEEDDRLRKRMEVLRDFFESKSARKIGKN